MLFKDAVLDELARVGNVAQFVALRPGPQGPEQSFSRVAGAEPNHLYPTLDLAARALLEASSEARINIRSYLPEDPQSREFVYGLRDVDEVLANVRRLSSEGLWLILNEMVDVEDGGVSGVLHDEAIEFAPDDTPRAVEKEGICAMPAALGIALLEKVYGFRPDLPDSARARVEFSVHPRPRGWRGSRTLLWEYQADCGERRPPVPHWPNRFSRHLGDKTFGLLVADLVGEAVPRTTVVSRRLAPFSFGSSASGGEVWMRTAPKEQRPGFYATTRGWTDPFRLLARTDPDEEVAAILAQDGIGARWSGAALTHTDGRLVIEGVPGSGDAFMLGEEAGQSLDDEVERQVSEVAARLRRNFGPVRMEWVWDGERVWIVQLHSEASASRDDVIVPGQPSEWHDFDATGDLEALRALVRSVPEGAGIAVHGRFGLTSHKADVLRKAGIPSRFV